MPIDFFFRSLARAGIYPASIGVDITPERLARFFVPNPARGPFSTFICPGFMRMKTLTGNSLFRYFLYLFQWQFIFIQHRCQITTSSHCSPVALDIKVCSSAMMPGMGVFVKEKTLSLAFSAGYIYIQESLNKFIQ
jgi:hypothetical protein